MSSRWQFFNLFTFFFLSCMFLVPFMGRKLTVLFSKQFLACLLLVRDDTMYANCFIWFFLRTSQLFFVTLTVKYVVDHCFLSSTIWFLSKNTWVDFINWQPWDCVWYYLVFFFHLYDVHKRYLVRCDWGIKLTCIVSNVIVWIYGTDFIPLHHCVVPCLSVVRIMKYIIQYLWFNVLKDCSHLIWNYDKK